MGETACAQDVSEDDLPAPDAREAALYERFAALGIAWKTVEHKPVFTVEEAAAHYDTQPGGHTKNLFLKDKKGVFRLVVARDTLRIDLNALNTKLAYGADRSNRMDFSEYDRIDDFELNEILWFSIKGTDAPQPPSVRRAIAYRPAKVER